AVTRPALSISLALGAIAALALTPPARAAGSGGVEGTVVDQQTSAVIAAGKVRVAIVCGAVRRAAIVDGAGHRAFADLPEGSCTRTASGGAYVASSLAVTVTGGAIATIVVGVTSKEYAEQLRKQQAAQMHRFRAHAVRPAAGAGGAMGRGEP